MELNNIKLAYHNKARCFICRRRNPPLHKVSIRSRIYAYQNFKIFIKKDSRACRKHLDKERNIKTEHYGLINHKNEQPSSNALIELLNSTSKVALKCLDQKEDPKLNLIFEPFKDLETLKEDHCFKITRLTKQQFMETLSYLTKLRGSKNRSKGQLLALYRFWLMKNAGQDILSYLKGNVNQQQISEELKQVRIALDRDFTPRFLGFRKQTRDFFADKKSETASVLYDINEKAIVLICDGGYHSTEKSSNNSFQYNSFSVQKGKNLLKSFLICSPSGYIYDLYVDFPALMNDAVIMRKILRNDRALVGIIKKGDYMFLDRGFRDIIDEIKKKFEIEVKIPYCRQMKSQIKKDSDEENPPKKQTKTQQPLTCDQSNEARRTTKVRSIVERVFGRLKKNKAIDNMRNTVLGHSGIDQRICAAFYNMTFKPLIDDCSDKRSVAGRLKDKLLHKNKNDLEFILRYRFSTQKYFKRVPLHFLDNFIQLKRKYLRKKIFFGSFHLRQAKSYLFDFIRINQAFIYKPPQKIKSNLEPNDIIVGFKLTSRYKRSKSKAFIKQGKKGVEQYNKVYKVYIKYTPEINMYDFEKGKMRLKSGFRKCDAIKGWICTCLNGRRQAGVCSHVATCLYYLSWARRNEQLAKYPGEHLKLIFRQNCIRPNKPNYIRNRRFENEKDSGSSSDESSDDEEYRNKKSTGPTRTQPPPKKQPNQKSNKQSRTPKNSPTQNPLPQLKPYNASRPGLGLEFLRQYCIFWGGKINFNGIVADLFNTCPIDNLLMGICILPKVQPNFYQILPQVPGYLPLNEMIKIINQIDRENPYNIETQWNLAKQKYVNEIMNPEFRSKLRQDRNNYFFDFYGSEYSNFIIHLKSFFKHNPMRRCTLGCSFDGLIESSRQEHSIFLIKGVNNEIQIQSEWRGKCQKCGALFETVPYFDETPPNFLIIQTNPTNIKFHETPDTLIIGSRNFKFLCATIKIESRAHFISIFRLNNLNYYVDAIGRKVEPLPPFNTIIFNKRIIEGLEKFYESFISCALYYLI